jgi:hypothetical protein
LQTPSPLHLRVWKRGNCSFAEVFASKRAKAKTGGCFCQVQTPLAVFFAFARFEAGELFICRDFWFETGKSEQGRRILSNQTPLAVFFAFIRFEAKTSHLSVSKPKHPHRNNSNYNRIMSPNAERRGGLIEELEFFQNPVQVW